jgi:excisionase family DNA binding protein
MGPKRVTVRDGRAPRSSGRGDREQRVAPDGLESQQGALPELIDVNELARRLCVSVHHVRRLVQERRIPYLKVGVFVRFDPSEVRKWLESRRIPEFEESALRPGLIDAPRR